MNPDGGWTGEFAPDMLIIAQSVESAHNQVFSLWQACLAGTWTRPCTREEIAGLKDSYDQLSALLGSKGVLPASS